MKINCGHLVTASAFLMLASNADAKALVLNAIGHVSSVYTYQDGKIVPISTGRIVTGDAFSLKATFNTDAAQIGSASDIDPTVNVYFLPDAFVTSTFGDFSTSFAASFISASVQLWNDLPLAGVSRAVDSQSFEFSNYDFVPKDGYAYDLGAGLKQELFSLEAFDFTGKARNSDLITEFAPFSQFGARSFTYSLYNSVTLKSFDVVASLDNATVSAAAVPEPLTWAMMAVGFGLLGVAMRHRGPAGPSPSYSPDWSLQVGEHGLTC